MLEMRPNCQCCNRDLAADALDVLICSFECTYCRRCAERFEGGRCPGCGGELSLRPPRARELWAAHPPSTTRVLMPEGSAAKVAKVISGLTL
ncbi:MAG: DUF1272 domain-containing protein [Opitutaceae bacterium]